MSNQLKRILFYLLGLGTIGGTPALLLHYGGAVWGEAEAEKPLAIGAPLEADEIRLEVEPAVVDSTEGDLWDDVFRTSDLDGEKATQPGKRYGQKGTEPQRTAPKGGLRVGCVCMDAQRQERKGRGSCNGHGGVRFWLYKMPDGEVLMHPTARHDAHPGPLNREELKQVDAHNPNPKKNPYQAPSKKEMLPEKKQETVVNAPVVEKPRERTGESAEGAGQRREEESRSAQQSRHTAEQIGHLGFYDLIVILIICITVAFVTQALFIRR